MPSIHKQMGLDEFKELLRGADENNDGGLSQTELCKALRVTGIRFPRFRAWLSVRKFDLNRNGVIDGDRELEKLLRYAEQNWNIIVK
ncbi:hypothetical protein BHE74_00008650 [Ensete ventricosum]|nr:hypothetical protein GW17_00045365 [Ensete ventricosum]RWW82869.1 hypothetical protein BHE74_00008650 [Ensete ventricosum]RZR86921.1 hypothetical protein BHM03_00014200 [Ensete ventricosum]